MLLTDCRRLHPARTERAQQGTRVCPCTHACVCVRVCVYAVHLCLCMHGFLCVCMYVCVHASVCMYTRVCMGASREGHNNLCSALPTCPSPRERDPESRNLCHAVNRVRSRAEKTETLGGSGRKK